MPIDLLSLFLSGGLAQYPDKQLYNAAKLLTPEERPIVPVRMVDKDPTKHFILKQKPTTAAWYNPTDSSIKVVKGNSEYEQGGTRLAALLAHEATHSKAADPWDEAKPYRQQVKTLKRLGETDQKLLKILTERATNFKQPASADERLAGVAKPKPDEENKEF